VAGVRRLRLVVHPQRPVRAAQVTQDLGWLAANIDIGQPPTPYRFFYIWLREGEHWRIAISHDSVSRRLDAATLR
jgi:hypothetical protein